jgi:hypothetical protein
MPRTVYHYTEAELQELVKAHLEYKKRKLKVKSVKFKYEKSKLAPFDPVMQCEVEIEIEETKDEKEDSAT